MRRTWSHCRPAGGPVRFLGLRDEAGELGHVEIPHLGIAVDWNQLLAFVGVLQLQFHIALAPGQIHFADGDIAADRFVLPVRHRQDAAHLGLLRRQIKAEAAVLNHRFVLAEGLSSFVQQHGGERKTFLARAKHPDFLFSAQHRPVGKQGSKLKSSHHRCSSVCQFTRSVTMLVYTLPALFVTLHLYLYPLWRAAAVSL